MGIKSKVLTVGDGAIGKTCLITKLAHKDGEPTIDWDDREPEYEPTTFNNFIVEWYHHITEDHIQVELWDTAGQEAFEQLRKLAYPGTDIYLVGYACNERSSLNNIQHKWLLELKEVEIDPWFIMVGTKCDLRAADYGKVVPQEDAEKVAEECNACAHIETSAKSGEGVHELKRIIVDLSEMKLRGSSYGNGYTAGCPRPPFGFEGRYNFNEEWVGKRLDTLKGDCKSEVLIEVQIRTDSGQICCQFPEDALVAVLLGEALLQGGDSLRRFDKCTLSFGGESLDIGSTALSNGICDGGTLTLVSCEKGNGQLAVLEGLHRAAHPPPPASIWDPERSRYSWQ